MHQKCSVDQPLGTRHGPGLGPMRPLPRSKHAHSPAAGRHQGAVLVVYVVLPSRVPRCLATEASAERARSIRNQPTTTSTGSPRRPPSPRSPPRRRSRSPRPTPRRKWRSSRQRPTRRRSRQVRLLGDVERGARRLRSLLPSTTTTAATVGAFPRALRGRVLTSCRGCRRYSSDEGRGKGCSGDGRGGEARPATGSLPPPTAPGPCTRRRLAAAFLCLRATRLGSRPCVARCRKKSGV